MKIDCYLSQTCGSEEALKTNISLALERESMEVEVNFYRIDETKATSIGVSGSPSIFINGKELQSSGILGFS
jgi:hypothetical protein